MSPEQAREMFRSYEHQQQQHEFLRFGGGFDVGSASSRRVRPVSQPIADRLSPSLALGHFDNAFHMQRTAASGENLIILIPITFPLKLGFFDSLHTVETCTRVATNSRPKRRSQCPLRSPRTTSVELLVPLADFQFCSLYAFMLFHQTIFSLVENELLSLLTSGCKIDYKCP
ncbi:hypothetical protein Fmac_012679 [Flemingia macrophylla]|uniref:Uncharacterized protein n=1 Tax=Flemingia macrophylla TaxID=520843 RepID=A0ABD1MQZ6_9FABA